MFTTCKDDDRERQRKCGKSCDLKGMKYNDEVSGTVLYMKISSEGKNNNYLLLEMVKDHMALINLMNGVKSKCVDTPYVNSSCNCQDFAYIKIKVSFISCKTNNDLVALGNVLLAFSKRKFSKITSFCVFFPNWLCLLQVW